MLTLHKMIERLRLLAPASRARAAGVAVLFVVLAVFAGQVQLRSNGDGWRILRSAQIDAPAGFYQHETFPQYFPFKARADIKLFDLVPMSSTAALVELISFVQRGLGCERFNFLWVSRVLLACYLGGLALIAWRARPVLFIGVMLLAINPYILAYFNSPYEESLVIALAPLLCYCAILQGRQLERSGKVLALLICASKVQFAPLTLAGLRTLQWRRNLLFLALVAMLIGGISLKGSKFSLQNGYNRFFNGLAYSVAQVSSWPAHDQAARLALAPQLVKPGQLRFPADAGLIEQYWGSSFWPTGNDLTAEQQRYFVSHYRSWYWSTLQANPGQLLRILSEPLATMVSADYRMEYIFRTSIAPELMAGYQLLNRYFGVLALAAIVLGLFISMRAGALRHVLYGLFFLGYPLLVVYGDGYYEFEKHLFPVLLISVMFTVAQLFAAPAALADLPARTSGPAGGQPQAGRQVG